jgi:hypothetical protein
MSARRRIQKYRQEGGAADLARVEVLVPAWGREEILAAAEHLRKRHRSNKKLQALFNEALAKYRTRILDNIDLARLPDLATKASVVARAMMDRGDAQAFGLGRKMLACIGANNGGH